MALDSVFALKRDDWASRSCPEGTSDILAIYLDRATAERELAEINAKELCKIVELDLFYPPSNPCMDNEWTGGLDFVFDFCHVTYTADGEVKEACLVGDAIDARVAVLRAKKGKSVAFDSLTELERVRLADRSVRLVPGGCQMSEPEPLAEELLGHIDDVNVFFVKSLLDDLAWGEIDPSGLRSEPGAGVMDAKEMEMRIFSATQCYWDRMADKVGLWGPLNAELECAEGEHERKVAMNLLAAVLEMAIPYPMTALQMIREGDFPECWREASCLWE